MRIAVTGAAGGLGRAFMAAAPNEHEVRGFPRSDLDVASYDDVIDRLTGFRPELIMHFAAMTAVDACEEDPQRAAETNVLGSFNVACAAREAGALLVALSTDYVFDGESVDPYDEHDAPNPISTYAITKLAGERVAEVAPELLVVRTAWLFGAGEDFFSRAVRTLADGGEIRGIVDQLGSPTHVVHLAERLLPLVATGLRGVVHLAGLEQVTWFDALARAVELGALPGTLVPQKADELGRPARRPPNSAITSVRLAETPVPPMPPLDDAIRRVLRDVGA